ncbi:hypothetical protein BDV10DRAFT_3273 [Aspergillus recurvatus]
MMETQGILYHIFPFVLTVYALLWQFSYCIFSLAHPILPSTVPFFSPIQGHISWPLFHSMYKFQRRTF